MTRFGVALDQMMRVADDEQEQIVALISRLGYDSLWTPAPAALERDAFQICLRWSDASVRTGRPITVGIAVVPLPFWTAPALAVSAGTLAACTQGRFILGVGPSAVHIPSFRARYGLPETSPVTLVREFVQALRPMLQGERVTIRGEAVRLDDAALAFAPPPVPIYMSALGPRMLELAGEVADGVCLNWCTPEQIVAARNAVDSAARAAGRSAHVALTQSIRVSIDHNIDVARRRLARDMLHYALAREGSSRRVGYRGHFARMGFDEQLRDIERMRDGGASDDELADAFPVEIIERVAYFGPPEGAANAVRRLAQGLDLALVRPVVNPGDAGAIAEVIRACESCLSR